MIKINLLPVRAERKKESAQQQITILVLSVIGVLLISLAIFSVTLLKISGAKKEITASEQEIEQLKKKIGEIDNLKKLQAEVKKKLDVLNLLRKEKTGPAKRLAKLSDATPEKLWLTKYTETKGDVAIAGVAFNEDLIAQFMLNMQSTGEFGNVELTVSEQVTVGSTKAKRFEITCVIKSLKKEEPALAPKKS